MFRRDSWAMDVVLARLTFCIMLIALFWITAFVSLQAALSVPEYSIQKPVRIYDALMPKAIRRIELFSRYSYRLANSVFTFALDKSYQQTRR